MRDRRQLARETFAALNRRDFETFLSAFAPDAEWRPLRSSTEGPYRGHAGIRAYCDDTVEMFEHLRAELEEVHEDGDVMLAFGHLQAKGRGSGAPVELVIAWVFRFEGDHVVWAKSYADPDQAIAESGIDPRG
jgi:ketosteroid isomerase-like protein